MSRGFASPNNGFAKRAFSTVSVHLVKLCVGAESVSDQKQWIARRAAENEKAGLGRVHHHVTRMRPRRAEELVQGGSLYWVIKGVIQARQEIIELLPRAGADGIERTAIMLKPRLILTEPAPRRAFQGWRYLEAADAPHDLPRRSAKAPPPELNAKLAELGLL